MNTDQVKSLSYELRLYGIHSSLERRSEEAIAKGLHPAEFLRLILEDEKLQRKDRFGKSLLARAKFRTQADLEDWDMSYDRGLSKQQIKELGLLGFYHSSENLIILGRTGEGKTQLANSLGRRLCHESTSVTFLPVNFLFEEVLAVKAAGKYLGYIKKITQTKVLLLDDFGLRNYTHEEANVLVDILEDRTKKGPVIITSQVDPAGWPKLFEDPVIAEAVVDRLLHPSQIVTLKGGSYRERLNQKPGSRKSLEPKAQMT